MAAWRDLQGLAVRPAGLWSADLVGEPVPGSLAGYSECDRDPVPAPAAGAGCGDPLGDQGLVAADLVRGLGDGAQVRQVVRFRGGRVERRLHVVTCWPDLIYWGSNGPSRRRWQWGTPPFEDGAILGHLFDDPADPEPLPKLYHEIELRLTDPLGATTTSVVRLLESMHRHVTYRVLPHVLNLR